MKKLSMLISAIVILFCLVCFSSGAAGENAQTAVSINLNQSLDIDFSGSVYEFYLKFTPQYSGFYEIELNNFAAEKTYITTYDIDGEHISYTGWNEFSNRCYDVVELTAGKMYYFKIVCFADKILTANIIKHTHDFKRDHISKASDYHDGYISYHCRNCDKNKKTIIPQVLISIPNDNLVYNGKLQKPAVTVKDTSGKTFKKGTDYTVTYPKSINVDSYSLTVEMKNTKYDISTVEYYYINPKAIKKSDIKLSKTTVSYGEKPTISISGLKRNKDFEYNVWYWGVGKQNLTVYGIGNYTGTVSLAFTVVPSKISGLKASKTTSSSIKLSWKEDSNYATDYYQIYDISQKKVVATINSDKTSYTIKKLKAGKKYSFKVRGYTKENGAKYYGEWKTIDAVTNPTATSIKSLSSPASKSLVVKWNKQSSSTGYQIQYSTNSKFTSETTKTIKITKNSQISQKITKLKSGKKYYVKIRTYKTDKLNGKTTTVYSSWSKSSSVKVK